MFNIFSKQPLLCKSNFSLATSSTFKIRVSYFKGLQVLLGAFDADFLLVNDSLIMFSGHSTFCYLLALRTADVALLDDETKKRLYVRSLALSFRRW